jgi:phosphohistidine phosphatase
VAFATRLGDREGTVEVHREIAPGGDAVALAHRLAADERKRVMLVGHEPDLSGLVAALLGGFERPFDKAMVVGLHLPPQGGRGRLRFVLDPKTLRLDPDARGGG